MTFKASFLLYVVPPVVSLLPTAFKKDGVNSLFYSDSILTICSYPSILIFRLVPHFPYTRKSLRTNHKEF